MKKHTNQQKDSPDVWWTMYIDDKKFRLKQETEAYHNQYMHFCRNKKDSLKEEHFLSLLAKLLSSKMYGNICTEEQAKIYIKNNKIK